MSGNISIHDQIKLLQKDISTLEKQVINKKQRLTQLKSEVSISTESPTTPTFSNNSTPKEKISLFRSLFKGREDVYALRFQSSKTGKSGYQPSCNNEWVSGICHKPKIKCSQCASRQLNPITDNVINNHLRGYISKNGRENPFVVGIYPLLKDETCHFLAIDFDKKQWKEDALAFLDICAEENISAYLERSRSGNGGHIWIFFDEPVYAFTARNLGSTLITKTLDQRPEIGLDSFDRFFPNQDTIPKGGFGNLIALPLQKSARERNHSLFIDKELNPFPDQWVFLSTITKLKREFVENFVQNALNRKETLPVPHSDSVFGEELHPWEKPVESTYPNIDASLPKSIKIVLSNQIFIDSTGIPPILRNRILRIASFSNPEFYKAQTMRLPTWNKPRILFCYEYFPNHIALPIGCLDDLKSLLNHYKIKSEWEENRTNGTSIDVDFYGELYPDQLIAGKTLLAKNCGVLSATTAFGKTVVALWLIVQRKTNTLILVHRKQLMDQWVERIVQFLSLSKKEIGAFGGGKRKRTGLIDVAMIQSVSKNGVVKDWVNEYGQIIVDECHHISAFSFEQAVRGSKAFYKVGLSATVKRKDGQHPIIFMNLGPIRHSVNAKQEAEKRSFSHSVLIKPTKLTVDPQFNPSENINELFRLIWENTVRNEQIAKEIIESHTENRKILVLTERTGHLTLLHNLLETKIENLFVLKGGLGKKQLKIIMADINSVKESPFVILATGRYLGEGFDLPNLDTLFLTFPISWSGTLSQYVGRLHREHYGKSEVIVYDYADVNIPVLVRMMKKRLKGYKALGYSICSNLNSLF